MRKIISRLAIAVSLIAGFLLPIVNFAVNEDFTIFTEIDPASKITVIADNVTVSSALQNASSYLRKDFGIDYFQSNYHHSFDVYVGTITASGGETLWGTCSAGDYTYQSGTNTLITVRNIAGTYYLQLWSDNVSADASDSTSVISEGHSYHIDIQSVNYDLTLKVYNDTMALLDTLVVSGWHNNFRYLYVCGVYNYAQAGRSQSFSIANLDTGLSTDIPVMITELFPMDKGTDNITFYGIMSYSGGSNVTAGIQWREKGTSLWNYSTTNTTIFWFLENAQYDENISSLSQDIVYEFRAYGLNDVGFGYGAIGEAIIYSGNFTTPTVNTADYYVTTGGTVTASGNITNWGGDLEGVWAGIRYREAGISAWNLAFPERFISTNYTANWSLIFGTLPADKNYEYQAYAWHTADNGTTLTGYGEIKAFDTYNVGGNPIVRTDNATLLDTGGSVTLHGTLISDGGWMTSVYFQWREVNTSNYTQTMVAVGAFDNDTFESDIYGIEVGKYYEYRAVAHNRYGFSYGILVKLSVSGGEGSGDTVSGTAGSGIAEFINDLRTTLGLTGTMGIWAFMLLLILLVSLIFGIAIIANEERIIKLGCSVAWLCSIIAIVGGFIFTGQLGIWPILVLVGGLVVLIMIIVSVKLSGGGTNA